MSKSALFLGMAILFCGVSAFAGEGDLEARLIMLQRADDGGATFAVRKNNKAKVKIKNNGPDEIPGAIEFQVFPGRISPTGDAIYRKVSKLAKLKPGELRDIEFDGIEITEEGYYMIQAMVVTIDDDSDTNLANNQVTRRPSRAKAVK